MAEADDMENDEKLKRQATRRVKAKRAFCTHLRVYVCVNAFLTIVYFATNAGGYFWPMWGMMGWGIGLLIHGLSVYANYHGKTLEEEIEIEYQRLKKKTEQ